MFKDKVECASVFEGGIEEEYVSMGQTGMILDFAPEALYFVGLQARFHADLEDAVRRRRHVLGLEDGRSIPMANGADEAEILERQGHAKPVRALDPKGMIRRDGRLHLHPQRNVR